MRLGATAALRPMRYRNFAVLWTAGLVSNVGTWMQTVAVGALVISRTGQASWVVLVAAGAFLPIGLLSPIGGALADRLPRRPVIAAGNVAAGVIAALIATLVAGGHDSPYALLALVTLQGAASALIGPFTQAILPDLVPRSEFLAASTLNNAQFNAGRIVGPAMAGGTIAALGYPATFVANALSFLAVVVAVMFVRLSRPPGGTGSVLKSVWSGFAAARGEPSCRAAIIAIGVVAFVAAPFIALVPAMAVRLTHGGPAAVAGATAALTTAQGAGAVAGALVLPPLAARFGRGRLLRWNVALLPVVLAGYGAAPSLWSGVAGLFGVGLVYMGVLSGLSTTVQLHAPQEYRGRVLSLFLVALGVAYPVGALLQGPVVDAIGASWTTIGAALALALACALVVVRAPGFVRAMAGIPAEEAARPLAYSADRASEACGCSAGELAG